MKKLNIITLLMITVCLASCDKEAIPVVEDDPRSSYFMPDPAASDEESVLRRSFLAEEKSYLLFNDTLRHEFIGVDYNGDRQYRTERVNIGYVLAGTIDGAYRYTHFLYSSMDEKRAAVDFMKNHVLKDLPVMLRPYSWLVTRQTEVIDPIGMPSYPTALAGQRSIAIALGNVTTLSAVQKGQLGRQIVATAVGHKLVSMEQVVNRFYAVSQSLYNTTFPVVTYTDAENIESLRQRGFIVQNWFIEGFFMLHGSIPSREKDLESYVSLVFSRTDEEVVAQYAAYPIVIQKYRLLKTIFEEEGYIQK